MAKKKKLYTPYVPTPLKSLYPPLPPLSQKGGMRMEMRMEARTIGEQQQVMKISPRVRRDPIDKDAKEKLFTFTGRKLKND